ncbi:nucleoside-diphosphate sugar epimerase [candidate division MSBL1 archaeon SCGC-AAA259I09]|uniref:Nucleoside-diphosphate sugar epimerase n=1 Tax=candidate division MSBL1 archaeon SCGC-AAA259I09 TaxID=1698267 RepID=A0A133USD3_9EURY|nr:nucleoside-diphosphate sugar epimerase [candidate division MSBL1 archaeon SCGC-AAA259I09]
MKVLVTGGAGFIGSHVALFYAEKEHEVIALDNLSRMNVLASASEKRNTAGYNWNYLKKAENIKRIEADIRNEEKIEKIANDVDAIIHCAGQVAVTSSLAERREDFTTNALGTFNVLEAARKAKTDPALVFTSTNKVYGNNVNRIPVKEKGTRYEFDEEYSNGISEEFPIDTCEHTPYGVSKLSGDLYVQDYAYRNELDAAVFRMSCIYGPRQFGVEDQGWVAHFIISILEDNGLTIYGDGKQVRDVLWVDDLVKAFDSFIERKNEIDNPIFNIGGGENNTLSLLELLDIVGNESGKRTEVKYGDWREGDQKVYVSDISKARKELSWSPQNNPDQGIRKFIDWYKSTG